MLRNKARAPLLAEGFLKVPSTSLGDARSGRSHCDKQNKTKQTSCLNSRKFYKWFLSGHQKTDRRVSARVSTASLSQSTSTCRSQDVRKSVMAQVFCFSAARTRLVRQTPPLLHFRAVPITWTFRFSSVFLTFASFSSSLSASHCALQRPNSNPSCPASLVNSGSRFAHCSSTRGELLLLWRLIVLFMRAAF